MPFVVRFALVFLGSYSALVWPIFFWPISGFLWFIASLLHSIMAVALALDFAEHICALWFPSHRLPVVCDDLPRDATAVLMVICDDYSEPHVTDLLLLAQAGYDTFLLDDSQSQLELAPAVRRLVHHIKRPMHTGAKAGNLNNWLNVYSGKYQYAIILDSDSSVDPACADRLLGAAAHPDNLHYGILQSKLRAWPKYESLFADAMVSLGRPRSRILERVHAPLGLVLSAGHNLLLRLGPLRAIGGFDECWTNEDTALSLAFAARGWGAGMVDIWSNETEPSTIASHNRRTIRWARQTAELFGAQWSTVPARLKLLVCRHFLDHLSPLLGICLLTMSLWFGPTHAGDAWRFTLECLQMQEGFEFYGAAAWSWLLFSVTHVFVRALLARQEGVSWKSQILGMCLGSARYLSLVIPLAAGIGVSLWGARVGFIPTNSSRADCLERSRGARILRLANASLVAAILGWACCRRPGAALMGFNLIWLMSLLGSPILLSSIEHLRKHPRRQLHGGGELG